MTKEYNPSLDMIDTTVEAFGCSHAEAISALKIGYAAGEVARKAALDFIKEQTAGNDAVHMMALPAAAVSMGFSEESLDTLTATAKTFMRLNNLARRTEG